MLIHMQPTNSKSLRIYALKWLFISKITQKKELKCYLTLIIEAVLNLPD